MIELDRTPEITHREIEFLKKRFKANAKSERNLEIFLKYRQVDGKGCTKELSEKYKISRSAVKQVVDRLQFWLEKVRSNPRLLYRGPKESSWLLAHRRRLCATALIGVPDDLCTLIVDRALLDIYDKGSLSIYLIYVFHLPFTDIVLVSLRCC